MIKQPEATSRPQAHVWDHRSLSSPFWSKLKPLHNLGALEGGPLQRRHALLLFVSSRTKTSSWLTEQRLIRYKPLFKKKKKGQGWNLKRLQSCPLVPS